MSKDANYISITADEREKSSTLLNYYYNGDSFNKLVDALEFLILNCPIAIECSVTNMLIAPCRDQGLSFITQCQWYFHILPRAFPSIDKI